MKRILTLVLVALTMLTITGCMEQVPAGTRGKILGGSGWQPEVIPPSKVYVNTTWTMTPEKLFLIETTTKKYSQPFKVLLSDKLTLNANVIFRGRVTGNNDIINGLFNDMPMNDNIVTTDEVYSTYGKMVVLNTAREVLSKYTVDDVNKNYARITTELYNTIKPKLVGLPFSMSDVTLGNIQYPKIVTDAIESAKQRRMEIEKEQAQVQIELTKMNGKEELAKAEYRIRMLQAKQVRDYNAMINEGITSSLLRLKEIEVQQTLADGINQANTVYMPLPMMDSINHMRGIK